MKKHWRNWIPSTYYCTHALAPLMYITDTMPLSVNCQVMAARDASLGNHRAASTLVTVPALARPEWLMEIAVVAAR